ncbi:MAG: hypothetical protein Q8N83_05150 [Ignavibacteria bacterium]|nr:hypothetical protein [Ignavibacteria bacterium]
MKFDSTYYNSIEKKLEHFAQKNLLITAFTKFQIVATEIILLLFVLIGAELIFRFSSTVRTTLFFVFVITSVVGFFVLVVLPALKEYFSYKENEHSKAADSVGRFFPSIKDELLNSLQLIKDKENFLFSQELAIAAFSSIYKKVEPVNFSSALTFAQPKRQMKYFFASLFIFSISLISFQNFQQAAQRFFDYRTEFLPPQKFYFLVSPGNTKITKGADVTVSVSITGDNLLKWNAPTAITLFYKDETEAKFISENLSADSTGKFSFLFSGVRNKTEYYCSAEGIESEKFVIEVVDKPVLQSFSLTVSPPAYSKLPVMQMQDNGNITTLFGSTVSLRLQASKFLKKAFLFFDDSTKLKMNTSGLNASVSFSARQEKNYQIMIEDEFENQNTSPVSYSIKLQSDAIPSINILAPNKNIDLGDDQRLPLLLSIADDFGFTKLLLHYRLSASRYEPPQEKYQSIEIPITKENVEQEVRYIWNLSPMSLATEDVITYYLEVFDNDNISGPKATKTGSFTVRFPSLEEILTKTDKKQDQVEHDLKKTLKEAEELKKDLDKINKELKQDKKEITWEEKEKIEQTLNKFEELQNKAEEIKKDLSENKDELQKHNLLSKETLDKYMELQKMFDEFSSDEMKKAMEKLQQKLQSLDRKQIQEALENMQFDEESFRKGIERTLNLLKRVQIEQKIDQLVKRTEETSKKQNDLQQKTEQADLENKNQRDDAAKQQEQLSNDVQKMKDELKQLEKLMSELKDMPKEEVEKLQKELEDQKNEQLSEEASENIQQKQKPKAKQKQMQLSQNMQKMKQKMQKLQQDMEQENQMEVFADLMKSLNNIISLSKDQEEAKKNSQSNFQSSQANKQAVEQDGIKRNLEKVLSQMNQLSQKTFAITPEMGKALGKAHSQMDNALEGLQNRNQSQTMTAQSEAMSSLNQAAMMMKNMMDQMMQGGGQGGSGMMSLMQQLQQMSGQQMSLNNMTQMLQQGMNGQLTPEQQGQMQRLAQQQEMIKKSLDELNREAKESGQSKKIPSNLDETLKQMQEVIADMKSEKLSDEIIQKQERILSRLLDAQRSMNERDFEKERESKSGTDKQRTSPGELNLAKQKGKDNLKDELNNLYREGYTKDYEELIKRYFEALQRAQIKN